MKSGIRVGHLFRRGKRKTSPLEKTNDDVNPDDKVQNNENSPGENLTWTIAQNQPNNQPPDINILDTSGDRNEEANNQIKKKKKLNPVYENLLAKGVVGKYVEDVDPNQKNVSAKPKSSHSHNLEESKGHYSLLDP